MNYSNKSKAIKEEIKLFYLDSIYHIRLKIFLIILNGLFLLKN